MGKLTREEAAEIGLKPPEPEPATPEEIEHLRDEIAAAEAAIENAEMRALRTELAARTAEAGELREALEYAVKVLPADSRLVKRLSKALTSTPDRITPLVTALDRVVSNYDTYRGKGVIPAPGEYADVVEAIEGARAALAKWKGGG